MSSREKSTVQEDLSPNLIPMIDIMFLLLLFFMLGADMGRHDNEELVLPRADGAREIDPRSVGESELTINVHHGPGEHGSCAVADNGGTCRAAAHWKWSMHGREYTPSTIPGELRALAELHPQLEGNRAAGRPLSLLKILIRADRNASYGDVQTVIEDCAAAGIYKIEVAAAMPVGEPRR